MDNEDKQDLMTAILTIVIVYAVKALIIVVIPSFLISQVLNYYGLDSNTIIISKVIVSLWLMSFMTRSFINIKSN